MRVEGVCDLLVMSVKREVEGVVAEASGTYPPGYKFSVLNEHYTHTRDTCLSSSRAHSFQADVIVFHQSSYSLNILQHIPDKSNNRLHSDPVAHKYTLPWAERVLCVSIMMDPSFVMVWNIPYIKNSC